MTGSAFIEPNTFSIPKVASGCCDFKWRIKLRSVMRGSVVGLARFIEISVNRSIYKRKTIIDMKIQESETFNGCSVYLFN